jgi:hypothetical protein
VRPDSGRLESSAELSVAASSVPQARQQPQCLSPKVFCLDLHRNSDSYHTTYSGHLLGERAVEGNNYVIRGESCWPSRDPIIARRVYFDVVGACWRGESDGDRCEQAAGLRVCLGEDNYCGSDT